jgi:hypothetical protein
MPELGAPLYGLLELIPDVFHGSHIGVLNELPLGAIPPRD